MSDFKNINDFRKGSHKKFPYQDPTYLSFALLFDWYDPENSPLLAGPAEAFLEKLAESNQYYQDRLEDLQNFKKALKTINTEMPWYWQSLKGLERLQKYEPTSYYWGGDDAKIEIETLESLNLPIAGLMHLYKKATFDDRKWTWIVPINLRKFKVYIYVTEVRTIQSSISTKVGGVNPGAGEFKPTIDTKNQNENIMGPSARPYFMFGLGYCEFDMTTGINIFADLSKNPEMAANSITFKYETLDRIEGRVLNGIITESNYKNNQISPAPDSEYVEDTSKTPLEWAKEKATGKVNEFKDKAKEAAKKLAEEKKREIEQEIRNRTVNRIPSMENVFSNFVRNIDNATDVSQQTKNIGNNINANVFGNLTGSTIQQGLQRAAKNALGNVFD
jgi:hypothetical protein